MSDDGAPANGPDNGGTDPAGKPSDDGGQNGGAGPNGPGTDNAGDAGKGDGAGPGDAGKAPELTAEEKLAEATKNSRKWEDRSKAKDDKVKAADAKAKAAEEKLAAVLKAAGLTEEDEDPTEAVKRATSERDTAVAKATAIEAERTAEKVARGLGADVDRTLDSRSVERALAALEDPTDTEAVKAVIEQALKDHPHLKAATARPSGAAELNGGGDKGKGGPMTIDQRRTERRKRRETSS